VEKNRKIALLIILAGALFIRLVHWQAVRDEPFFSHLVMDSEEYDRWAGEIAAGDWLGSEVFFQAPLYPYFLAVVYSLFGHSYDVVYLFQILLALAGIYALFRAGRRIAGEKVGLAAAVLSALYGVYLFYDVHVLKESLAVSTVCFLLWALVEARVRGGWKLWMLAGVFGGLLALLRENTLLIIPLFLLLTLRPKVKARRVLFRNASFLAGVALVLLPVAFRNWLVGGNFLPTTFQGGVNFYIGNNPQANGTYRSLSPGKEVPSYERTEPVRLAEMETGRSLSPYEVSRFWLQKSLDWIKRNPGDFLLLQVKKTGMFWSWYEWPDAVDYYFVKRMSPVYRIPLPEFGSITLLALIGLWFTRKRLSAYLPVFLFVVLWMVSTVLFFLFSRYRLPVVPALILIGAAAIEGLVVSWRKHRSQSILVVGLVVFSFVFPHFIHFKPKMELVHYNLGLIYEKTGRLELAIQHFQQASALNPNDFLSCVQLGNIASRQGNWGEALDWYLKAESIEPDAEGVWANIGRAYVALQQYDEAKEAFDRALEINAENVEALHNKAVLFALEKRYREALELNKKVLHLVPGYAPALRFREKLERVMQER